MVHYLAHPLFDMNGTLTVDTVERMLLLFNVLEGRNGARVNRCNGLLREIAASLTPEALADMAARQGIEPYGETPWRKALTGGSDDHTGLFVAGALHRAPPGTAPSEGFLAAVARGDCRAGRRRRRRPPARAQHLHAPPSGGSARCCASTRRCRVKALSSSSARASGASAATCRCSRRRCAACAASRRASTATATAAGPAWEALLEREIGALARLARRHQRRRRPGAQPPPLHGRPATRRRCHQPPPAAARRPRRAPRVASAGCSPPSPSAWSTSCSCRTSSPGACRAATGLRRSGCAGTSSSTGPSDPKIAVFTDTVRRVQRRLGERPPAGGDRGGARPRPRGHHVHERPDRPPRRRPELPGQRVAPPRAATPTIPSWCPPSSTCSTTSRRTTSRPST